MWIEMNNSFVMINTSGEETAFEYVTGGTGVSERIQAENSDFAAFTSFLFHDVLSVSAAIPYLFYIFFTFRYKALLQPKNVFKSNFAFRYYINS